MDFTFIYYIDRAGEGQTLRIPGVVDQAALIMTI